MVSKFRQLVKVSKKDKREKTMNKLAVHGASRNFPGAGTAASKNR
jgi:hypothetical protein